MVVAIFVPVKRNRATADFDDFVSVFVFPNAAVNAICAPIKSLRDLRHMVCLCEFHCLTFFRNTIIVYLTI